VIKAHVFEIINNGPFNLTTHYKTDSYFHDTICVLINIRSRATINKIHLYRTFSAGRDIYIYIYIYIYITSYRR